MNEREWTEEDVENFRRWAEERYRLDGVHSPPESDPHA